MKVGSVSKVALHHGDALVTFNVKGTVQLGSYSTAHIRTGSLLGQRVLALESTGSGTMHPRDVIPISRTSSPYSLSEAISDLATNVAGTDTATLNQSLDTLSATLDQIAPQLGPAFDGVTRLSQALNGRNKALGELLKGAGDITGILSQRSEQLNTLILNANDLLGSCGSAPGDRPTAGQYLGGGHAVEGVVHDNEQKLAPTLQKLNAVTAMLEKNRDNLAKALPGLAKYQLTQAETVSEGFYYTAFVPNLLLFELFQPFFDYFWGFKAYGTPGYPPDTAGPRALFPWPYNGIPGGSR